jgi:hypothetical protein
MKLLIPPDPLALFDWKNGTPEQFREAEQAHRDWLWKWKREVRAENFSCARTYLTTPGNAIDPHHYDLVDYFASEGRKRKRLLDL